jgi:hypothetical protein
VKDEPVDIAFDVELGYGTNGGENCGAQALSA